MDGEGDLSIDMVNDNMKWKERIRDPDLNFLRAGEYKEVEGRRTWGVGFKLCNVEICI